MLRYFLVIFVVVLVSACTIKTQDHGYDFNNEDLKKLKVQRPSKEEVRRIMGEPSVISSIDTNSWYYISLKTKNIAILKPKISKYKVLELKFDKKDRVYEVIDYSNDKIKKLDFNKWESPSRGSKDDLLQDFIYNMGRFNKPLNKK